MTITITAFEQSPDGGKGLAKRGPPTSGLLKLNERFIPESHLHDRDAARGRESKMARFVHAA